MQNAKCKMQNAKCRMQNAECRMKDEDGRDGARIRFEEADTAVRASDHSVVFVVGQERRVHVAERDVGMDVVERRGVDRCRLCPSRPQGGGHLCAAVGSRQLRHAQHLERLTLGAPVREGHDPPLSDICASVRDQGVAPFPPDHVVERRQPAEGHNRSLAGDGAPRAAAQRSHPRRRSRNQAGRTRDRRATRSSRNPAGCCSNAVRISRTNSISGSAICSATTSRPSAPTCSRKPSSSSGTTTHRLGPASSSMSVAAKPCDPASNP